MGQLRSTEAIGPARRTAAVAAQNEVPTGHLSRAIVAAAHDFEAGGFGWGHIRERLGGCIVALDVLAARMGRPHLTVDVMPLPGVGLSWLDMAGLEMSRSAAHAHGSGEGFTLTFPLSGSFVVRQNGREARIDTQAGVLLDGSEPSTISVRDHARLVGVRLGGCCRADVVAMLSEFAPEGRSAGLAVLRSDNPCFVALKGFVQELRDPTLPLGRELLPALGERLRTLLRSAIEGGGASLEARALWLRRAALALIARHFDDPTLSIRDLANWLGASERELSLALADDASSDCDGFDRLVMQARLAALARRLREADARRADLADLAINVGLIDDGVVETAFRETFGVDPENWRNMRLS
jgi:AraC-like DNA-binding protein